MQLINESLAPIVLFVFARPLHTTITINSLLKNTLAHKTDIIIYSDASATLQDIEKVNEVRNFIRQIKGFKSIKIIERDKNYGLARNIIEGVTAVCNEYGRAIVLEDDLITSPAFLQYMNNALDFYEKKTNVWHISAWNYPIDTTGLPETFLWREMNCWGWGTWQDRWQHYKKDPIKLVEEFTKEDISKFNLDDTHKFWDQILGNFHGTMNTWAIFWYATIFKKNGLCLNPAISLIENIGFDDSGENCNDNDFFSGPIASFPPKNFPDEESENNDAVKKIKKFYQVLKVKKTIKKAINFLKIKKSKYIFEGLLLFYFLLKRKITLSLQYNLSHTNIRLNKNPINRTYGHSIGTPIDRFYINNFLLIQKQWITGDVLEVSENTYTKKYGIFVSSSKILDYAPQKNKDRIYGDLTEIDTIPNNKYDCFVCTQTLNFIYDIKKSIYGIHHLLKENGVALITLAGLTHISRYDMDRWGDYWRLTTKSANALFAEVFGEKNIEVDFYGNSLSACFLMQGVPSEEMTHSDLHYKDPDYQIIITVKATKRTNS